jgi:hypothetical protein
MVLISILSMLDLLKFETLVLIDLSPKISSNQSIRTKNWGRNRIPRIVRIELHLIHIVVLEMINVNARSLLLDFTFFINWEKRISLRVELELVLEVIFSCHSLVISLMLKDNLRLNIRNNYFWRQATMTCIGFGQFHTRILDRLKCNIFL